MLFSLLTYSGHWGHSEEPRQITLKQKRLKSLKRYFLAIIQSPHGDTSSFIRSQRNRHVLEKRGNLHFNRNLIWHRCTIRNQCKTGISCKVPMSSRKSSLLLRRVDSFSACDCFAELETLDRQRNWLVNYEIKERKEELSFQRKGWKLGSILFAIKDLKMEQCVLVYSIAVWDRMRRKS